MIRESETFLRTIFKLTARNVSEDLFFKGLPSVLGILFTGGLQFALGKFAFMISFADLMTILARSGYKAYKDIQKTKFAGTTYNVHTTQRGLLVAENTSVSSLKNLPVKLPVKAQYPLREIVDRSPMNDINLLIRNVSFRQLDSSEVFKALSNMRYEGERYYCGECAQLITIINGGAQSGHAPVCSHNNNRYAEWCDECRVDLTKFNHKPNCRRAFLQKPKSSS